MQEESQQGDSFPSQQLGRFRSWGSTSTGLEERQPSFFGTSLAEPVWQSFTPAFGCGWQHSSSLAIVEPPTSMLRSGRVGVCMTAGRALGGAQHAEPQAMVRGEEIQGSQVRNKVFNGGWLRVQRTAEERGEEGLGMSLELWVSFLAWATAKLVRYLNAP